MPDPVAPPKPVEFFPALTATAVVRHGFVGRIAGIDVATDRAEALNRLDVVHRAIRFELDLGTRGFATAEQVHGNRIALIDCPLQGEQCFEGADGLVTDQPAVSLGIYVADCCAIFIVDPTRRCLGLVHSGRKGTESAIVSRAIETMSTRFGSVPRHLVIQLSPAIRPPHYEVDFTAEIIRQAIASGVTQIYDSGVCTACDLSRYYSYRAEKGRTGRMLAMMGLQ